MLLNGRRPDRFARAGAWIGLLGAGAITAGAITIAAVDQPDREPVSRSILLGASASLPPFVALAGWTARRRTRVQGYSAVRKLAWTAYGGSIALGVSQLFAAMNDTRTSRGMTLAAGALGVLSVLPLSFDSYVCARQSRLAGLRLVVTPLGVAGRF